MEYTYDIVEVSNYLGTKISFTVSIHAVNNLHCLSQTEGTAKIAFMAYGAFTMAIYMTLRVGRGMGLTGVESRFKLI